MRLATMNTYWGERLSALVDGVLVDLSAAHAARLERAQGLRRDRAVRRARMEIPPEINDFLVLGPSAWDRARELIDWAGEIGQRDPDLLRNCRWEIEDAPLSAVIPRPSKLWCMGANYMDHRREMAERNQQQAQLDQGGQGFIKSPTSIIGPYDTIVLPPESQHVDYEMELAFVIGHPGRRIPEERAMEHIFGYTVFNDVSARDIVRKDNNRMDRGKGFDTFGVMGSWLVTADEVPDPHNLKVRLKLNGELRQDGTTADLISRIPRQIAWLSSSMTLEPGDMFSTGTPSGVGPLSPGDLIEGEVESIGEIRCQVIAEPSGA
jgi:2-keto-4-pentenoate hydratase/2-oxohepta-3-ene-1,7-dioic acid hydratase in catechol pathway